MSEQLEKCEYYEKVKHYVHTKVQRFIIFDDSKGFNTLFVTREDNVYGFGSNFYGGLGYGHQNQIKNPTKVLNLSKLNIRQFIPGTTFVLAVNDKNDIFSWGNNDMGQLGRGYTSHFSQSQPVEIVPKFAEKMITQLSCGSSYAMALTSNGQVYGWGDNSKGQLGCGKKDNAITTPILIKSLLKYRIKTIHCCFDQSYALTNDGHVLSWGWNTCCQLGHDLPIDDIVYEPLIINISDVKTVCPAFRNTYFLTNDGLLYFCGIFIDENKENTKPFQLTPKPMKTELTFDSINSCVENQDICMISTAMSDKTIFCLNYDRIIRTKYYTYFDFYSNEVQMTLNTINVDENDPELNSLSIERLLFTHITGQANEKSSQLINDSKTDHGFTESANIYQLFPVFNEIDPIFVTNIKTFHIFDDWRALNVIFITTEDEVYSFGSNSKGCLGLGHDRAVKEPETIPELFFNNIKKIINGLNFVLALTEENQLFSWGWNLAGQLGRGYISKWNEYLKPEPILFDFGSDIIEISCGSNHTLVLLANGVLYGWGSHKGGQLGLFNQPNQLISEPTKLSALDNYTVKSIFCAGNRSFALTVDGLVLSWGTSQWCALGHDIEEGTVIWEPKLIDISNISMVCLSSTNTYFLSNDKTLYFCGLYQNEDNSDLFQLIPKPIETDIKFDSIDYLVLNRKHISIATAFTENTIYYLDYNMISKTKFKNSLNYYSNETQMTYKTINVNDNGLKLTQLQDPEHNADQETKIKSVEEVSKVVNEKDREQNPIPSHSRNDNESKSLQDQNANQYEILGQIGSGGFGKVFKVKNNIKNELFAIKLITFKRNHKEKVMREVHTISTLRGDCIIQYYSSSIEDNCLYIQMELCDQSLKTIIDLKPKAFNRTPSEPEFSIFEYFICCQLFKELLESVEYLHETIPLIIHRDLKPENLLIKNNPINGKFLKICDFGLSTIHRFESMKHTSKLGTQRYMSPEVVRGRAYDFKADIYSTGLIAQELFYIDINTDESEKFDEKVKENYKKLCFQIQLMTQRISDKRPSSSQVLAKAMEWCVDRYNVEQSTDFEHTVNRLKEFENIFFYNYFMAKF